MKKYVFKNLSCFILILIASCGHAKDHVPVNKFALDLKQMIVSGDVKSFRDIPCVPHDCIENDDVEYVFGTKENISFIKEFLSRENLKIKIYGPYTYSDNAINKSFSLVYYDPAQITFNKNGYMSAEIREKMWWKGYVETVVILKDGKWAFHYTPFYHGAHLPWAEDY